MSGSPLKFYQEGGKLGEQTIVILLFTFNPFAATILSYHNTHEAHVISLTSLSYTGFWRLYVNIHLLSLKNYPTFI